MLEKNHKKSQKIKLLYGSPLSRIVVPTEGFNPDAQNFKVSQTASFRGSKVRKKIIREKSKIYKNSQNAKKSKNY
jgi:hypothetical protein